MLNKLFKARRSFRNKKTGDVVRQEYYGSKFYKNVNNPNENLIPSKYIENSNDWKEIKFLPIFITVDGVSIYDEEQEITFVRKKDYTIAFTKKVKEISSHSRIWDGSDGYIQFSSEEAALEHIMFNKPCLCLREVIIACELPYHISHPKNSKLEELVKKKLNL